MKIQATYVSNHSPSFVVVKDQLIVGSTSELVHHLIDALAAEQGGPSPDSSTRVVLFGKGGPLCSGRVRSRSWPRSFSVRALPPRLCKQVEAFIHFADRLGEVQFDIHYGRNDFR